MVNCERRLQQVGARALAAARHARPTGRSSRRWRSRSGATWTYRTAEDMFREIARLVPGYRGMSWATLLPLGPQWADRPGGRRARPRARRRTGGRTPRRATGCGCSRAARCSCRAASSHRGELLPRLAKAARARSSTRARRSGSGVGERRAARAARAPRARARCRSRSTTRCPPGSVFVPLRVRRSRAQPARRAGRRRPARATRAAPRRRRERVGSGGRLDGRASGINPDVQLVFWALVKIVIILNGMLGVVSYLIFAERKIAGHMQARTGPNRVGPFGLLQPIADVVKLFFKEEFIPAEANKVIFHIAPMLAVVPALVTFSVVPFGPDPFTRHRHQRRPAAVPRHVEPRRLRDHARRLVLEQQVRAARRPALLGADDLATSWRWGSRRSACCCWRARCRWSTSSRRRRAPCAVRRCLRSRSRS